jgi:S1-C subfamily serine protease
MLARIVAWVGVGGLAAAGWAASPEIAVRRVNGDFPKAESSAIGSGSGVIVGKHLVLTNRHVVEEDDGKLAAGFRVLTAPDYAKGADARVISICENYDLALVETKSELAFKGISVLDSVAPLSQRVTAYGFPLGSRFGIALTTTGGQISRQPIATADADDDEEGDSFERSRSKMASGE